MRRSLSLFLGAAAGVNAIIGGEILAVQLSDDSFICAEDCVHQDIFFGTKDTCFVNETTIRVDKNGQDLEDPEWDNAFSCKGEKPRRNQVSVRQPKNGEEPEQCIVHGTPGEILKPKEVVCISTKIQPGGPARKVFQLSEIQQLLQSAAGQGAPQQNKPATQRTQQECAREAQRLFSECRGEGKGFTECEEKGTVALENCRNGQ